MRSNEYYSDILRILEDLEQISARRSYFQTELSELEKREVQQLANLKACLDHDDQAPTEAAETKRVAATKDDAATEELREEQNGLDAACSPGTVTAKRSRQEFEGASGDIDQLDESSPKRSIDLEGELGVSLPPSSPPPNFFSDHSDLPATITTALEQAKPQSNFKPLSPLPPLSLPPSLRPTAVASTPATFAAPSERPCVPTPASWTSAAAAAVTSNSSPWFNSLTGLLRTGVMAGQRVEVHRQDGTEALRGVLSPDGLVLCGCSSCAPLQRSVSAAEFCEHSGVKCDCPYDAILLPHSNMSLKALGQRISSGGALDITPAPHPRPQVPPYKTCKTCGGPGAQFKCEKCRHCFHVRCAFQVDDLALLNCTKMCPACQTASVYAATSAAPGPAQPPGYSSGGAAAAYGSMQQHISGYRPDNVYGTPAVTGHRPLPSALQPPVSRQRSGVNQVASSGGAMSSHTHSRALSLGSPAPLHMSAHSTAVTGVAQVMYGAVAGVMEASGGSAGQRRRARASNKHMKLFGDGTLSHGDRVEYRKGDGSVLLWGSVELQPAKGIRCSCCNSIVSCSTFEQHAGMGALKSPYQRIFTQDNMSLAQLAAQVGGGASDGEA